MSLNCCGIVFLDTGLSVTAISKGEFAQITNRNGNNECVHLHLFIDHLATSLILNAFMILGGRALLTFVARSRTGRVGGEVRDPPRIAPIFG